jgi:nucleoside-triphosphatase THEP1
MSDNSIYLLCGSSESGKTTTLLRFLDQVESLNLDCRGILCPPVFEDSQKTAINILNVSSREERHLAVLNLTQATELATHRWILDTGAVEWGNTLLEKAVPCDILFVDELGPLEYDRGQGLIEGFTAIDSSAYQLALVTLRPSLLEKALLRWPSAKVIQVSRSNQAAILRELMDRVQGFSQ